jgi:folate-binding protein YgfZ
LSGGDAAKSAAVEVASRSIAFDLSARAKFRITGADRLRFINGQITNDVGKAAAHQAIHAAILNAKGRMNADMFLRSDADCLVVDADPALREALPARLERYIIADDVQVDDVSDEFALFHLIGTAPSELTNLGVTVRANRFGVAGMDLWSGPGDRRQILDEIARSCVIFDEERAETFRIEHGIPRWGRELSEEIIPVEANLESMAIDYAKGCYIGQEVISRMKMSGQTNKRLFGLISVSGEPLREKMQLFATDDASRAVGWITSATRSPALRKEIALAFVRRGHNAPGTRLLASATDRLAVDVTELPFV